MTDLGPDADKDHDDTPDEVRETLVKLGWAEAAHLTDQEAMNIYFTLKNV